MSFYIKILTDYYHFLVGDLSPERKKFLDDLLDYFLLKDEYGYDPFFEGESLRCFFLLKCIAREESPMSFETYLMLQKWHREDAWSVGELREYFLCHRKGKEIKVIFDFDNASVEEIDILDHLDAFLRGKNLELKILNIHNGRYIAARGLLQEIAFKKH